MFAWRRTARTEALLDTVIGSQTEVRGRLVGVEGSIIRIDGRVQGEVVTQGDVVVGEEGVVLGDITARSVAVAGTVRGDVTASASLELLPTARLEGNVLAAQLAVAPGAAVQGTCRTGQPAGPAGDGGAAGAHGGAGSNAATLRPDGLRSPAAVPAGARTAEAPPVPGGGR